jgi:tetratricopeptide (TPR) repeat protein
MMPLSRFMKYGLAGLLAFSSVVGCATTGTPASKSDEDEAGPGAGGQSAAETAAQAKQREAARKAAAAERAKLSSSVKAEFAAAVKKWEAAKAQKTPITASQCESLASSFQSIKEPVLAALSHFNAGTILEGCGQDKDAESEYQAALQANPNYAPAMANIGGLYYKRGNPTTAKTWFEKAIQADPTHAGAAWANLGAILYKEGKQTDDKSKYKEAISKLRRALAIDAYDSSAYGVLALVYYALAEDDKSKLDLAQLVCKQERDIDDNFAPIYNTLGLIQLRKKNPSEALRQFEKAVALDPKMIEAHLNIGAIGLSTRQYDKAAQAFAAALKLDPKNFDATIGIGVASRGLKKIDEAESWYKKAATLDPQNCAVQYNLGVLYQDYKTDPTNANLNTAKDYLGKYRSCSNADHRKVADAERRMKDIDEVFAALEQQKKMEAELKVQQEEMERQQKAMQEQQKAQDAAKPAGADKAPDAAAKPSK